MSVKHTNLKYLSIERLESIRDESYRSSCGQIEYCKETIDNELNRKYSERDERQAEELINAYNTMEETMQTIEQTEQTTTQAQTKKEVLPWSYNSEENAFELPIDTSHLGARNAMRKFTKRKHWIEHSKRHGYRYCYSSFDSKRNYWCTPKKGTYNAFLAMRLNDEGNDIHTVGFYSSYDAEKTREKYSFDDAQTKVIDDTLGLYAKVSEAYDNAKKKAEEKRKETRKELSEYKFNELYTKDQITKCTSDMSLIKISVQGYSVKKRCRNEDYFIKDLFYFMPEPDGTIDDYGVYSETVVNKANKLLEDSFRSVRMATITAKKCTYNAPKGDSLYYGMSEMPMSTPLAQNILIRGGI